MNRFIVMLGSDFSSPGGISAVLRNYRDDGLDTMIKKRIATSARNEVQA